MRLPQLEHLDMMHVASGGIQGWKEGKEGRMDRLCIHQSLTLSRMIKVAVAFRQP